MFLYEKLLKYSKEVYPMHMPGHKGGRYKLIDHLYEIDVTEVADTDHLYNAEGVIKESLQRLSEFYGTRKSIYLVNGSTVGILSAITGVTSDNDEILIARNCHHSVYNALTLQNLQPKYIYPKLTQWGLIGGIDTEELSTFLYNHPRIVAFVMTSPTYDGFISDIKEIQRICTRYNVILIVDEAHGAHLPMSKQLPISAVEAGADIVIHSLHKTLPTFTGSGLLHLNLPTYIEEKVLKQLQIFQTSSPSYVMMAQMDACVEQLGHKEDLWKKLLDNVEIVEKKARKLKKLYMIKDYINVEEGIVGKDPLKNSVIVRGTNITGTVLEKLLRSNYKYQLEMSSELHGLAIFTIADKKKPLMGYVDALIKIDRKLGKPTGEKTSYGIIKTSEQRITPYESVRKETVRIKLIEAKNKVSASMITPYPPGIPAIVSGEVITEEALNQIIHWVDIGIEVLGIEDGMVVVIK